MESQQKEITIKEVDPLTLEALIYFSYTGKLKIGLQNVQNLMRSANINHLNRIKNACADHLNYAIKTENVFEIRKLATELLEQLLMNALKNIF